MHEGAQQRCEHGEEVRGATRMNDHDGRRRGYGARVGVHMRVQGALGVARDRTGARSRGGAEAVGELRRAQQGGNVVTDREGASAARQQGSAAVGACGGAPGKARMR